jgi:lipoprotein-anchoring transpeptidase ErfK/SrfK
LFKRNDSRGNFVNLPLHHSRRGRACAVLVAFACLPALAATPPVPPAAPAAPASVATPAKSAVAPVPAATATPPAAVTSPVKPSKPVPTVLGEAPLAPGEFAWLPQMATGGPLLVIVNIKEQMAYVYRNGLRIGRSSVSTGKTGHETPTGVFTILQKNKDHRSSIYNNAPMPYMQRLTWDGIALHAGNIPGYPASHGCVRLPYKFSELLFGVTTTGVTVVIAQEHATPAVVAGPPLVPKKTLSAEIEAAWSGTWTWKPELAPEGILTIVLSEPQETAIVLRNGIEIGRARLEINGPPLAGTTTYVLMEGASNEESRIVRGRKALNWLAIGDGSNPDRMEPLAGEFASRVSVPEGFARTVYENLKPGATVVITDESLQEAETGSELTVLRGDEVAAAPAAPATPAAPAVPAAPAAPAAPPATPPAQPR